ncbi:MAG TPA: hypothetical protein VN884_08780 [Candidatus Sulfotelmatobacter sp.]|jgi:hypothetical protein|nr:hypothetical protein [Candidatus Sulfotelmatobacter sp.]
MDPNKRTFLTTVIPIALGMPLGLFCSTGFSEVQAPLPARPEPAQSPGAPRLEQTTPSDEDIKPNSKKAREILKQNQLQIAENVEKIYTLAGELKGEVEKTDAANTLSLPMIQKAEQIEKLAKQVKNLARGA